MERLDRAAAVTRQLALGAHCGAEARQGRGQDPIVGGDRTAAPAEIIDLADPGEVPLDDTKVGRACAELVTKNAVAAASNPRCQCFILLPRAEFNPADAPVEPDRNPNRRQVKLFQMPSGRYREACEQGHSITLASCLERSPAPRGVFQDRTHGRLDRAGDCLNTSCHRVGGFVCH